MDAASDTRENQTDHWHFLSRESTVLQVNRRSTRRWCRGILGGPWNKQAKMTKQNVRAGSQLSSLGTGGGSRSNLNDEVIGANAGGTRRTRQSISANLIFWQGVGLQLPDVTLKCDVSLGIEHGSFPWSFGFTQLTNYERMWHRYLFFFYRNKSFTAGTEKSFLFCLVLSLKRNDWHSSK